jgi:flavin-dependent dehydrogenase
MGATSGGYAADIVRDVVVVGGGPAGSTSALELLERGLEPVILEREPFPRYHIGESLSGEAGAVLRRLGLGDAMEAGGFPVKHGVVVFGASSRWWVPVLQRTPSGLVPQTTWQVRRSDFDELLLAEARKRGATVVRGRAVAPIVDDDGRVAGVEARLEDGRTARVLGRITLDCSGQATFLANQKVTGDKYLGAYDKQIAIFAHVEGYERDGAGVDRSSEPGNTHIFYRGAYHWAWAIPLDDRVTSIGVVVPAAYFRERRESKDEFLLRELRELNPALCDRTRGAALVERAHAVPNYSFQVRRFAGPGFICVGDAHRFVDPIFSFGVFVALREAGFAAAAAHAYVTADGVLPPDFFDAYMVGVEQGIDMFEDVIDTFWESPLAFAVFAHSRYRDGVVDVFAGRVYDDDGLPTADRDRLVRAARKLLGRERDYDEGDLCSVPIGSRFHPERAPLWEGDADDLESTERWMRADV